MSEIMDPEVIGTSEVLEEIAETVEVEAVEVEQEEVVTEIPEEKTLFELVEQFKSFMQDDERMKKAKEGEAIKSAFYKKLSKDRSADENSDPENNPFAAVEDAFKEIYARFKEEKAEYNRKLDQDRAANFEAKQAVIEDLKALLDKQEDVNATFAEFRQIQNRWREIGPVPVQNFRDLNDTYQYNVEKFYDMVKINHDLRDLDFKKNLEAKQAFCEAAEKLSENENVVEAFRELQKLHEQWKEFGPVAKEFRDSIWERFKAATAVINKKYQAFFEEQKSRQGENLEAKKALCEQVEALAEKEVTSSNEWNDITKQIEGIQAEWKKIGFASKKDNQKIYDRFRAACDKFFEKKREFYSQFRDDMNANLEKKMAIIEAAEALKSSTEWKKATDQFINLQKQWKEIGAVPRKKSEQLWKRFRAACDEFFAERDKQSKPENDFYANLKAKKKLVEEIEAFAVPEDPQEAQKAQKEFADRWQAIGFVPFKEKENITKAYRDAMNAKFPRLGTKAPRSLKETLIQKFNTLQQDITTFENNIGFFSMSKNSEPLINQMKEKIESAKKELEDLKAQIRSFEQGEE